MSKKGLVEGVGINDSNYKLYQHECVGYDEKGRKILNKSWRCPFYERWSNMYMRSYSDAYHRRYPTYKDCEVSREWLYFMDFRSWMEKQDWEGKVLDKDLLFPGNKIYGPDTCIFIDKRVNLFISDLKSKKSDSMTGVKYREDVCKYVARIKNHLTGKTTHLGYFFSELEAHKAWLTSKLEQAYILAAEQTDPRVAKALIERYENYGKLNSHP